MSVAWDAQADLIGPFLLASWFAALIFMLFETILACRATEALPPRWESRAALGEAGKCSEELLAVCLAPGGRGELRAVTCECFSGIGCLQRKNRLGKRCDTCSRSLVRCVH